MPQPLEAPPELLRVATAGSVDDGKSTLIGRLLHDTKSILEDQLEAVQRTSVERGDGRLDLALLTDGLRAEREQGITIDVAYRFFATARRSFILADTPGHVRYTRNMVTGASTADLALVLIDARQGVLEQSRRHAFIASLLRVPHVVAVVNKMDLVDFDEDDVPAHRRRLPRLRAPDGRRRRRRRSRSPRCTATTSSSAPRRWTGTTGRRCCATSRRSTSPRTASSTRTCGCRCSTSSARTTTPTTTTAATRAAWRAGRCASATTSSSSPAARGRGSPASTRSTAPLDEAGPAMSVTVRLADDLDVSRGQVSRAPCAPPVVARELVADVCWLDEQALLPGGRYLLKAATRTHPRDGRRARARHRRRHARSATPPRPRWPQRHRPPAPAHRGAAGAGPVRREPHDRRVHPHRRARRTHGRGRHGRRGDRAPSSRRPVRGARTSCATSARSSRASSAGPRSAARGGTVWLTGLPSSGKSTIASALEALLVGRAAPPTCSTATRCATA